MESLSSVVVNHLAALWEVKTNSLCYCKHFIILDFSMKYFFNLHFVLVNFQFEKQALVLGQILLISGLKAICHSSCDLTFYLHLNILREVILFVWNLVWKFYYFPTAKYLPVNYFDCYKFHCFALNLLILMHQAFARLTQVSSLLYYYLIS